MDKKIRVGIIGTGFGARVHAPMMSHHPGFEVVSIASVARGNVDEVREQTGINQVYANWVDMLDNENLDLVSVVSAPFLHKEMVLKAFQKGIDVLCEKPMAFDTNEAEEMITARDQANRIGMINFEWRFLPARLKVKELLDSGKLGQILHVHYSTTLPSYVSSHSRRMGWLGEEAKGGGMLGALGSHMFDSLLWWLGDSISNLSGQVHTHVPEYIDEQGKREIRTADDSFQVIGQLGKGTTFHVGLVYASRHNIGRRLEVIGSNGTIVMTQDNQVQVGFGNDPLQTVELEVKYAAPQEMKDPIPRYYTCFYPMLNHVYEAVANRNLLSDLPTFEHGYEVQKVLDAVRESSKEGRKILLG